MIHLIRLCSIDRVYWLGVVGSGYKLWSLNGIGSETILFEYTLSTVNYSEFGVVR